MNTTQAKKEATGRSSKNDRQIVSPPAGTDSSNKTQKKRTLKRNVCTTATPQIPSKQAKQVTDEHSPQNAKQESQFHDVVSNVGQELPQNSVDTPPSRLTEEPVTPAKTNKNADACSLSDLESPVVSLVFSQSSTDTTTPSTTVTSKDESSSCVDESENESASVTQRSQDVVRNSHEESAVTDDFDSDYNRHKIDTEMEDSDDCTERTNARLCVERDVGSQGKFRQRTAQFGPH